MPDVTTHLYADDGTRDMYDLGRCVTCGLPERNDRHQLPDKTSEMREHRRRAGEEDDTA